MHICVVVVSNARRSSCWNRICQLLKLRWRVALVRSLISLQRSSGWLAIHPGGGEYTPVSVNEGEGLRRSRTDGRRMVIELRSPHGKRSVFRVSDS